MVITLPEIKRATRVDTILQCGDIHPQPGPHNSKSNTNEGKAARLVKATKYATIAHLNVCSMVLCENFHLVKQTILSNESIFLQSRRLGWTLRRLTLIYIFLATFYLEKTVECTRMVVELLFMLKIPTRLLLSKNCLQFLIVTSNSSGLRYSVKSLNPSFCVQFIGPRIRLLPSLKIKKRPSWILYCWGWKLS